MLVVGVLGAAVAGVYCNDLSAQAMECCASDPASCGEPPRAVADDCCQKVPAGKESADLGQTDGAKSLCASVPANAFALSAPAPAAGAGDRLAAAPLDPKAAAPTVLRL